MKNLLTYLTIIIVAAISLKGKAQEVKVDSLSFRLKVIVNDFETTKPIYNCEIKVIGTDGSSQDLKTDYYGRTEFFVLKANTSYSIVGLKKDGYMNVKGKETTVGETRSKTFIHEYSMRPFSCPTIRLYEQYYKHNATTSFKAGPTWEGKYDTIPADYYYNIMTENPTLIIQITGYQDASEKDNISIKRAKEYVRLLIKLGIDKKRLIAYDGGVKVYKEFTGRKDVENEKKEENRIIEFRIVSDDYKTEVK